MDACRKRSTAWMPVALGAAIVAGCLVGLGAITEQNPHALDQWMPAAIATPAAPARNMCRYCGIVERVHEIENSGPGYQVSTVMGSRDAVILMLLGALSGAHIASDRPTIFEVSVRMDDGSIRAVRGGGVPEWKAGDRVKIVKGRIAWMS